MLRPFTGFLCSDLLDVKLPVTVAAALGHSWVLGGLVVRPAGTV
jgi:hypothetical protein